MTQDVAESNTQTYRGIEIRLSQPGMVAPYFIAGPLRRWATSVAQAQAMIDAALDTERTPGPRILAADVSITNVMSAHESRRRTEQARGQRRVAGRFAKAGAVRYAQVEQQQMQVAAVGTPLALPAPLSREEHEELYLSYSERRGVILGDLIWAKAAEVRSKVGNARVPALQLALDVVDSHMVSLLMIEDQRPAARPRPPVRLATELARGRWATTESGHEIACDLSTEPGLVLVGANHAVASVTPGEACQLGQRLFALADTVSPDVVPMSELGQLRTSNLAFMEALTPSIGTRQAYAGEFHIRVPALDEEGNEVYPEHSVPWDVLKQIMAAILARALGDRTGPIPQPEQRQMQALTVVAPSWTVPTPTPLTPWQEHMARAVALREQMWGAEAGERAELEVQEQAELAACQRITEMEQAAVCELCKKPGCDGSLSQCQGRWL